MGITDLTGCTTSELSHRENFPKTSSSLGINSSWVRKRATTSLLRNTGCSVIFSPPKSFKYPDLSRRRLVQNARAPDLELAVSCACPRSPPGQVEAPSTSRPCSMNPEENVSFILISRNRVVFCISIEGEWNLLSINNI